MSDQQVKIVVNPNSDIEKRTAQLEQSQSEGQEKVLVRGNFVNDLKAEDLESEAEPSDAASCGHGSHTDGGGDGEDEGKDAA